MPNISYQMHKETEKGIIKILIIMLLCTSNRQYKEIVITIIGL